jgi:hypothetical protein
MQGGGFMKANPGGHIPPKDLVGREELITVIWRRLEGRSVVLSAERRMGKTCIIKKMNAEPVSGTLTVLRDLEKVRTPEEFAELVFHDVEAYLGGFERYAIKARRFLTSLGGSEVGGVFKFPQLGVQHWKSLLSNTIEDLVEHKDCRLVFFWDELPLMIYNIKQSSGESAAMEVLDLLRSLRQTHESLRMVFTGSIGLHNVLTSLKSAGYANDPVNDMAKIDVPPLLVESTAIQLSEKLLIGEKINCEDRHKVACFIAESVNGFPFYIQHVIEQMALSKQIATFEMVKEIVSRFLIDDNDPWELRHFRTRIDTYYESVNRQYALVLLDILAGQELPVEFDNLFNLFKSKMVSEDTESVRHALTLLQLDHYITKNLEGTYHFRFPIIRRWWRLERGI